MDIKSIGFYVFIWKYSLDRAINIYMDMVTTKRAQEMLEKRGIKASYPTIAQWVREGRFPGALRDETERGPVWRIPVESVRSFKSPAMGRPTKPAPTEKRGRGAANASKGASSKKGGKK
jgi:hypothetical protein